MTAIAARHADRISFALGAEESPPEVGDERRTGGSRAVGRDADSLSFGSFVQIVVAVLGLLTITGEYSTGLIRSTLAVAPPPAADPGCEGLLVAGLGLVPGVVGVALSYLAGYPARRRRRAPMSDPMQRVFWDSGL